MAAFHALLLTDIVDSTRLTEQLDEASAIALWSAHDRLARDLIPRWRGREIDKTDGMLLLFDTVADALGYAFDYHRMLREHGLGIKARAGIHHGAVTLRANPADDVARGAKPVEVDGIALPMVARVMSIAGGGQTLVSDDARRALGPVLQPMRSHGHWQLHGIAVPVELHEVVELGMPYTPPADGPKAYRVVRQGDLWQPVREIRHTLPAERDSFVGRVDLLQALDARLDAGARLVSVLGMGGVGKTRLATRLAWMRRARHAGGAWFCNLDQARGADGLAFAVAQGLEVPLGADPVPQLGQALAGRGPCLVVLDNFEQVARHAEETLGRWLERAPQAQFVVTTREVLGIVGEEIVPVAPLTPDEAVDLFLKRAMAAQPGPAPDAEDAGAVVQLVEVLDGLPLAIELAAARTRLMSPRALLARMKDRFDLLRAHAGRHDRQATLRAAFDWSWDLLSEAEKATLARLAVFAGGFTLESAAAVARLDEPAAPAVVDLLQWLVDKSLVRRVGDERFDLVESLRQYAGQQLRAEGRFAGSGPACEAEARARHWRHFAAIDDRAAVADRCAELNNLVAACRAAAEAEDAPSAVRCLVGAWTALRLTGPYRTGVELAGMVAGMRTLADHDRGWVHGVAGDALDTLGEVEPARHQLEQGLACAARAADAACRARLLIVLGGRQALDGELEVAIANLTEAHRASQALGDPALEASALIVLGRLMDHQARFAEARSHYEQALAIAVGRGDRRCEGGVVGNLGGIHHALGEIEQARSHYERALAIAREVGDRRWEGNGHCNLGLLYQELGMNAEAQAQFDLALGTAREVGFVRLAYTVLCNLGILLTVDNRLEEAVQHLEQAVAGAIASSDHRSEGQFRGYLGLAQARQGRLLQGRESLERGEALLVAIGDRLSLALLLCDRAEVERLAADHDAARLALQRARRIADELDCGPRSELRRRLAAIDAAAGVSR